MFYLVTLLFLENVPTICQTQVLTSWDNGIDHRPNCGLLSRGSTQKNKEIEIRLRRHKRASRADNPAWLTNERGD
jgi:hypothetical protein